MIEWHSEDGNWISVECDGCGRKLGHDEWERGTLTDLDERTATRKLGDTGWIMFQTFGAGADASPVACPKPECVGIASTRRLEDVARDLAEIAPIVRACLPSDRVEDILFGSGGPSPEERGRRDGYAGVAARESSPRYMAAWQSASRAVGKG